MSSDQPTQARVVIIGGGSTGGPPSVVVPCAADVWTDAFGLHVDQCLIVRPDQHVAYSGPLSGVATAWTRMFGTRAGG